MAWIDFDYYTLLIAWLFVLSAVADSGRSRNSDTPKFARTVGFQVKERTKEPTSPAGTARTKPGLLRTSIGESSVYSDTSEGSRIYDKEIDSDSSDRVWVPPRLKPVKEPPELGSTIRSRLSKVGVDLAQGKEIDYSDRASRFRGPEDVEYSMETKRQSSLPIPIPLGERSPSYYRHRGKHLSEFGTVASRGPVSKQEPVASDSSETDFFYFPNDSKELADMQQSFLGPSTVKSKPFKAVETVGALRSAYVKFLDNLPRRTLQKLSVIKTAADGQTLEPFEFDGTGHSAWHRAVQTLQHRAMRESLYNLEHSNAWPLNSYFFHKFLKSNLVSAAAWLGALTCSLGSFEEAISDPFKLNLRPVSDSIAIGSGLISLDVSLVYGDKGDGVGARILMQLYGERAPLGTIGITEKSQLVVALASRRETVLVNSKALMKQLNANRQKATLLVEFPNAMSLKRQESPKLNIWLAESSALPESAGLSFSVKSLLFSSAVDFGASGHLSEAVIGAELSDIGGHPHESFFLDHQNGFRVSLSTVFLSDSLLTVSELAFTEAAAPLSVAIDGLTTAAKPVSALTQAFRSSKKTRLLNPTVFSESNDEILSATISLEYANNFLGMSLVSSSESYLFANCINLAIAEAGGSLVNGVSEEKFKNLAY